jgi:hypothetical protein
MAAIYDALPGAGDLFENNYTSLVNGSKDDTDQTEYQG